MFFDICKLCSSPRVQVDPCPKRMEPSELILICWWIVICSDFEARWTSDSIMKHWLDVLEICNAFVMSLCVVQDNPKTPCCLQEAQDPFLYCHQKPPSTSISHIGLCSLHLQLSYEFPSHSGSMTGPSQTLWSWFWRNMRSSSSSHHSSLLRHWWRCSRISWWSHQASPTPSW